MLSFVEPHVLLGDHAGARAWHVHARGLPELGRMQAPHRASTSRRAELARARQRDRASTRPPAVGFGACCRRRLHACLAFCGERRFERGLSSFIARAAAIALEQGLRVRYRETRVMRAGDRQQLAGIAINRRTNVSRSAYDALRALLYNAARFGAASQDRAGHADSRGHLAGCSARVASTHPQRGQHLQQLFARIHWQSAP